MSFFLHLLHCVQNKCINFVLENYYLKKRFSIFVYEFLNNMIMEMTIKMSQAEYRRFQAFKEADKIVRSVRNGLREAGEAKAGKRILKSAYQLADEL